MLIVHCNIFQARYVEKATALHCSTVSFLRTSGSEQGLRVLRLPDVKPPCSTARQVIDLAGFFWAAPIIGHSAGHLSKVGHG
jgi:hypothetical protein